MNNPLDNRNSKVIEFEITSLDLGRRLDILLSNKFSTYSRSLIKKIIESNQVEVNDKIEFRANYHPKVGDKIKIKINPEDVSSRQKLIPQDLPITIVYEDENLLAVNKAYGMVVHPADGNWSGTLMNAVMFHYSKEMESIAANTHTEIRAGLIHRLDKETSGLVLIGKTNAGLYHFTKLFSERKVRKYYLVLAEGPQEVVNSLKNVEYVENFMGRNPLNRKKVRSFKLSEGENNSNLVNIRVAKTYFYKIATKIDKAKSYVLLLAKPETGRTHQIRVHVNDLNLKIVGDSIYGNKKNPEDYRMMLHSYALFIKNTDGKELYLKAEPQQDFTNIIERTGFDYKKLEDKIESLLT